MLRFLYVVLFEQSFDSSTDWGERASVERPSAAGYLQRFRRPRRQTAERSNKRWVLFIVFNVW
jgi:hypothetical protein